jgi:hypothetical protein
MGTVYAAEDTATAAEVAVKVLALELAGDERFRQRFLRERHYGALLDGLAPGLPAGSTRSSWSSSRPPNPSRPAGGCARRSRAPAAGRPERRDAEQAEHGQDERGSRGARTADGAREDEAEHDRDRDDDDQQVRRGTRAWRGSRPRRRFNPGRPSSSRSAGARTTSWGPFQARPSRCGCGSPPRQSGRGPRPYAVCRLREPPGRRSCRTPCRSRR